MSDLKALLYGFNREDLDAIACGLESEPTTINVGNTTGEGDELLQSTASVAAKFIRAALSAEPAQEMTDECAEDIRALADRLLGRTTSFPDMRQAALLLQDMYLERRASRLPEMSEGDWPSLPDEVGVVCEGHDGHPWLCIGAYDALAGTAEGTFVYTADQLRAAMVAAVEAYKALVRGKT